MWTVPQPVPAEHLLRPEHHQVLLGHHRDGPRLQAHQGRRGGIGQLLPHRRLHGAGEPPDLATSPLHV